MRIALFSFVLVACVACAREEAVIRPATPVPPASMPPARAESAILVVVDSLRPDAVRDVRATPAFARLAAEGIALDARSAGPWCKPAVASILTSLDPDRHGAINDANRLSRAVWTLPEVLRCEGFATAAFVANGFVSDRFGFDQGWDRFRNYIREGRAPRASEVLSEALAWIDEHRGRRFLLYVHLIDPHAPYDPPAPFAPPPDPSMPAPARTGDWIESLASRRATASDEERAWLRRLYDGEVRSVDAALGAFVDRLDAMGVGASTLLVVTSDHGEQLGERGVFGHALDMPELLPVPLVIRGPARPTAPVQPVSTRDLAPTIAEALDVALPVRFEGRSFGPRGLAPPSGPRLEYHAPPSPMSRELCLELAALYYGVGDCSDRPTASELVHGDFEPAPTAPCP